MDYYRDVTYGLGFPVGGGWVKTTLPNMHVRLSVMGDIVWRHHESDVVMLNGRIQLGTAKAKGNYPACFRDDGQFVYVQHEPGNGLLAKYDLDGNFLGQIAAPYAAEGIWSVDNNERVIMGNDPSLVRHMPNGETWLNCVETSRWIVGQSGRDPDYGGSISRFHKPTGKVERWLGYTNQPPRAAERADGTLVVALSGADTPDPDQIVWAADFPPLPATTPEPPPPQPPVVQPPTPDPPPVVVTPPPTPPPPPMPKKTPWWAKLVVSLVTALLNRRK